MRAWSQAIFYFDQLRFWDKVNVKRGEFLTLNVNLNESWCWQESRYYTCGSPTYLSQLIFNADVHFFRCFSSPAKHPLSKSTTLQPMVLLRLHFQMMKIVMLCISMSIWVSVEKKRKTIEWGQRPFPPRTSYFHTRVSPERVRTNVLALHACFLLPTRSPENTRAVGERKLAFYMFSFVLFDRRRKAAPQQFKQLAKPWFGRREA